MTTANTYRIPAPRLPELRERIGKLNQKAAKIGTAPIVLTVESTETETARDGAEVREWAHVSFTGEQPRLEGWEFLAKLLPLDGHGMNLIQTVPGASVEGINLTAYHDRAMDCDHCQQRRRRKATFLVRHDSGALKVVGSSCLSDFTGHARPEDVLRACEFLLTVQGFMGEFEEAGWGESLPTLADPLTFLAWTARTIDRFGWVSKKKATESFIPVNSTASEVSMMLFPGRHPQAQETAQKLRDEVGAPTEAEKAEAAAAIEWAASLDPKPDADYLWNLKIIAEVDFWTDRNFGLGASLLATYRRQQDQIREAARAADASEHVGAVKQRLRGLDLEILETRRMDNQFGTILVTLEDGTGNRFKWWASSGGPAEDLRRGARVTLTGTVKAHGEFRGVRETVLTRCKVEAAA